MRLRSRFGSVALAVVGALYGVAASAMLIWVVVDTWSFAGRRELALYLLLAVVIAAGGGFLSIALRGLGVRVRAPRFGGHRSDTTRLTGN